MTNASSNMLEMMRRRIETRSEGSRPPCGPGEAQTLDDAPLTYDDRAPVVLRHDGGEGRQSPGAISNPLDTKDWTGTIGVPIPSTEAAILDDEGREVAIGDVDEICIRGPQVMKGYWNRPDETAKVLTQDRWLRTGDMGFMDARGYFKITDRKKDMIVVSGFKVFPNEIEDVAMMHAGVLEAAAVGATDPKSGEVVKLFVVRKDPTLTAEAVLEHCRKNLTGYKVPKIIEFRDDPLPKTGIGKILRRQLRGTRCPPESPHGGLLSERVESAGRYGVGDAPHP